MTTRYEPTGTSRPSDDPLVSYGWDARWNDAFRTLVPGADVLDSALPGRVVAQHRSRDIVVTASGEHASTARTADERPAVGDWVALLPGGPDDTLRVAAVLPRRSAFVRKSAGATTTAQVVAANVDLALLVAALPHDFNERRLERYTTLAWESGAVPVVVLTKADLSDDVTPFVARASLAAPGVDVVVTSTVTGVGLDALAGYLRPGVTAVLLGSSGAGKSTLLNRLAGDERMRTADVRRDGRGRHTTTHRELVRLTGGALVIDTPGMRELQLWHAEDGLDAAFADVAELATGCRFRDCVHDREPGCAVRAAVEGGSLPAERLESWHALRRELAWLARRDDKALDAQVRKEIRGLMRAGKDAAKRKGG